MNTSVSSKEISCYSNDILSKVGHTLYVSEKNELANSLLFKKYKKGIRLIDLYCNIE